MLSKRAHKCVDDAMESQDRRRKALPPGGRRRRWLSTTIMNGGPRPDQSASARPTFFPAPSLLSCCLIREYCRRGTLLEVRHVQAMDYRVCTRTRISESEVESVVDVDTANSNTQLEFARRYLVGHVAPARILPRAS